MHAYLRRSSAWLSPEWWVMSRKCLVQIAKKKQVLATNFLNTLRAHCIGLPFLSIDFVMQKFKMMEFRHVSVVCIQVSFHSVFWPNNFCAWRKRLTTPLLDGTTKNLVLSVSADICPDVSNKFHCCTKNAYTNPGRFYLPSQAYRYREMVSWTTQKSGIFCCALLWSFSVEGFSAASCRFDVE